MTLREFIELLEEVVGDIPEGDKIEVVAWDDKFQEGYTPVVSVRPDKSDGVRRLWVA